MLPQNTEQLSFNTRIGLIGDTQSGKTTYLAALPKYCNQTHGQYGPWACQGVEQTDDDWLEPRVENLENGYFPQTSSQPLPVNIMLYCSKFKVTISTEDRPGDQYWEFDDQMVDYLAHCDGLIFLLEPGAKPRTPALHLLIDRLLVKMDRKLHDGRASGQPLPQAVAVCLSQYDDHEFFQWLSSKKYLEAKTENRVQNTPMICRGKVTQILENREQYPDGVEILEVFKTRFHLGKVDYLSISSVGFLQSDYSSKSINWSTCKNVFINQEGVPKIQSAPDYHPVNLFDPITSILARGVSSSQ